MTNPLLCCGNNDTGCYDQYCFCACPACEAVRTRDQEPYAQLLLTPFAVWCEKHDGTIVRLTLYGAGLTWQERLTDATTQAKTHPDLAGAKTVVIR